MFSVFFPTCFSVLLARLSLKLINEWNRCVVFFMKRWFEMHYCLDLAHIIAQSISVWLVSESERKSVKMPTMRRLWEETALTDAGPSFRCEAGKAANSLFKRHKQIQQELVFARNDYSPAAFPAHSSSSSHFSHATAEILWMNNETFSEQITRFISARSNSAASQPVGFQTNGIAGEQKELFHPLQHLYQRVSLS